LVKCHIQKDIDTLACHSVFLMIDAEFSSFFQKKYIYIYIYISANEMYLQLCKCA
jgi:hypothetical protein